MRSLWIKDERGNPTHSFKDRVVAVALASALELGFRVLACPSTGNLANAVAAAAARAGIRSVVLIPADLEPQKIIGTAVYGGTVVTVQGSYDDVNRLASELADDHEDWAFVNVNVRPYYAEGSKTIGFEVAEQLGWRLPPQIVVPVASGAQLVKIDKAFRELASLGLVDGGRSRGCSARRRPAARRWRPRSGPVRTWCSRSGRPPPPSRWPSGTRRTGPTCLTWCGAPAARWPTCRTTEMVDAIRLLAATEGIFAETAGGVTLATLRKLLADGLIDPGAETVIINSGDGLKTLDAVAGSAAVAGPIRPSLAAFAELES